MPFDIAALLPLLQSLRQNQQAASAPGGGGDVAGIMSALNAPSAAEQGRLDYQASQLPSNYAGSKNPFATGFFVNGASQMSPEARLASQGNNATNQWAQMGQMEGIDPAKLQSMNAQTGGGPKEMPNYAATGSAASPPMATTGPTPGVQALVNPMLQQTDAIRGMIAAQTGTNPRMPQQPMPAAMPGFWTQLLGSMQAQPRF